MRGQDFSRFQLAEEGGLCDGDPHHAHQPLLRQTLGEFPKGDNCVWTGDALGLRGGVLVAMPLGTPRVSCPASRPGPGGCPEASHPVPLSCLLLLWYFLFLLVDPPPSLSFSMLLPNIWKKSKNFASPQHRMLSDFQMWGALPSRWGQECPVFELGGVPAQLWAAGLHSRRPSDRVGGPGPSRGTVRFPK